MTATKAQLGYGFELRRGDGLSPENFTAIAETRSISDFGQERGIEDVTHSKSPDAFMEYIKTLKDGAQFQLGVNLTEDNAAILKADADDDDNTPINWRLVLPGALPTYGFSAHVLSFKFSLDPRTGIQATVGFKITGPIDDSASS